MSDAEYQKRYRHEVVRLLLELLEAEGWLVDNKTFQVTPYLEGGDFEAWAAYVAQIYETADRKFEQVLAELNLKLEADDGE